MGGESLDGMFPSFAFGIVITDNFFCYTSEPYASAMFLCIDD